MRAGFASLFLTIFFCFQYLYALEVPYLAGRVNDNAGILTESTVNELENILESFEQKTSCQIAVLTIKSLEDESIEDYSIKVVESWKLGQKGKDNGVLFLVAQNDRRMRIEVGYGLESTLTDYITGRIISNEITPCFKNKDYDGGITNGINSIIKTITNGEYISEVNNLSAASEDNDIDRQVGNIPIIVRILLGFFIFGILGLFTFLLLFTSGFHVIFLYLFLIPFWAVFPMIVVGTKGCLAILVIYLFGIPAAKIFFKKSIEGKKIFKKFSKFASAGSSSGTSGSSGSSISSGGFSGGGGSFGGGGSSGSW